MLAKSIGPDEDVEYYINNTNFAMSQKLDGERAIIQTKPGTLACWNRSGAVRAVEPSVREAFEGFPPGWTLDGEVVGKVFYPFDVLSVPQGEDAMSIAHLPSYKRHAILDGVMARTECEHLIGVRHYTAPAVKKRRFESLLTAGAEGVIFTRLTGVYQPERSGTYLKFKFVKDVDCVVIDKTINGRDNLALGVYDSGSLVEVGHCSALTGDGPNVSVGDVVTVTVLYATRNNRLYQPVKPILRNDKAPNECVIDQLQAIKVTKEQL